MSAANETRLQLGSTFLAIGLLLIFVSYLSSSAIAGFAQLIGIALASCGAFIAFPVALINSLGFLAKIINRSTEPVWEGEILHTDGSEYKVRYSFDDEGCPWFVAGDICIAAGTKAPAKDVLKWGGIQLVLHGEHSCFSEENVQAFLIPLATKSHDANRLLILIRNNVLRRLEKQRHADKMHG